MAQLQYIGARYVPKYYENSVDPSSSEWEAGKVYEALTVVTWNDVSYTSKIPVPANIGAPDLFPAYWVKTVDMPAAIHALQEEIADIKNGDINDGVLEYDKFTNNVKRIINNDAYAVFVKNSMTDPSIQPNGAATLFVSRELHKSILLDASKSSEYQSIKDALEAANITHIDYFILTHYHTDHYGCVDELIADGYIDTDTICYLPLGTSNVTGYNEAKTLVEGWLTGCTIITISTSTILSVDGFTFRFINCDKSTFDYYDAQGQTNGNTYSVGVYVSYGNFKSLMMGDMSGFAIDYMSSLDQFEHCNLLNLPHHGATTDSDNYLCMMTTPENAIAHAGLSWQYTHNGSNEHTNFSYISRAIANANACNIPVYLTGYGDIYVDITDFGYEVLPSFSNIISYQLNHLNYVLYVDASYEGVVQGTKDKPFNSIKQALGFVAACKAASVEIKIEGQYDDSTEDIYIDSVHNRLVITGTLDGSDYNVKFKTFQIRAANVTFNYIKFHDTDVSPIIRGDYATITLNNCLFDGDTTSYTAVNEGAALNARSFTNIIVNDCTINEKNCVAWIMSDSNIECNALHGTSNKRLIVGEGGNDINLDDACDIAYTIFTTIRNNKFMNSFRSKFFNYSERSPYVAYRSNHAGTESTDVFNAGAAIYNNRKFLVFASDGQVYQFLKGNTNSSVSSSARQLHDAMTASEPNFAITISGTEVSITFANEIEIVAM